MIEGALHEVGGQKYLVTLARRPEIFAQLPGKLIPKAIQVDGDVNLYTDFRARLEAARRRVGEARGASEQVARPDFLKEAS
jgi:hypothetical protein